MWEGVYLLQRVRWVAKRTLTSEAQAGLNEASNSNAYNFHILFKEEI